MSYYLDYGYSDYDFDGEDFDAFDERVERFRDPGGESALHPGKQTEPCPTCGKENRLTKQDVRAGYQCDACARMDEMGW